MTERKWHSTSVVSGLCRSGKEAHEKFHASLGELKKTHDVTVHTIPEIFEERCYPTMTTFYLMSGRYWTCKKLEDADE